jgi:hypothetical protein
VPQVDRAHIPQWVVPRDFWIDLVENKFSLPLSLDQLRVVKHLQMVRGYDQADAHAAGYLRNGCASSKQSADYPQPVWVGQALDSGCARFIIFPRTHSPLMPRERKAWYHNHTSLFGAWRNTSRARSVNAAPFSHSHDRKIVAPHVYAHRDEQRIVTRAFSRAGAWDEALRQARIVQRG